MSTVGPGLSVGGLIAELSRRNVGALVVVENGAMVGIVSVVRVADIMAGSVFTCLPTDSLDSLAETMTERRIRHLPVVEDGRLLGIVSIGDVVKTRIDELQCERDQLESYIEQG